MERMTPDLLNWLYPVTGFYYHEKGIIVKRSARLPLGPPMIDPEGKRGSIKGLSMRSLQRLAFLVGTSSIEFLSLMTLTYGQKWPKDGGVVRKHRNAFLTWLRRSHSALEYVWFLEFQKRGAPHFHLLLSVVTPSDKEQQRAGEAWVKIASKAHPETSANMLRVHQFVGVEKDRFWSNIRERDGAIRYMRKYAGKGGQKRVPAQYSNVGRFWGASRGVSVPAGSLLSVNASEPEVRELLCALGREDVATWDVLPKLIHT